MNFNALRSFKRTAEFRGYGLFALAALLVVGVGNFGVAQANSWSAPKEHVEWAFKFGAVSVALEKCPFKKGPRFAQLEKNAAEIPATKDMRTQKEGREFMLILDGTDLSALCGTALRFFGLSGRDLAGLLALKKAPSAP